MSKQSLTQNYEFLSSARTTLNTTPVYVMQLELVRSGEGKAASSAVAAACSDHCIRLYDLGANGSITLTNMIRAHSGPIRDLRAIQDKPGSLVSASEDGTVCIWDSRTTTKAAEYKEPSRGQFFAAACQGTTLVAGGNAVVYRWDLRKTGRPIALQDYHTEEVTQIQFHPHQPDAVFSASTDGLVCEINLAEQDPELALGAVLNTEQPISKFGFFGPEGEYIYALSTVETLSLWKWAEGDQIANFADLRAKLSTASRRSIDYLINCHYRASDKRLFLTAGQNNGAMLLAHVNVSDCQPVGLLESGAPTGLSSSSSSIGASSKAKAKATEAKRKPQTTGPSASASASTSGPSAMDDSDEDEDIAAPVPGETKFEDAELSDEEEEEEQVPVAVTSGHSYVVRDTVWLDELLISGGQDSTICVWGSKGKAGQSSSSSSASSSKPIRRADTQGASGGKRLDGSSRSSKFTPY